MIISIYIIGTTKNIQLVITAIIFFFQQEQVIIFIPFILYSLYQGGHKGFQLTKSMLSLGGGFIAVLLPILCYFYFNGALKDFWYCAFVFNNTWYITESYPGLISQLITIKKLYLLARPGRSDIIECNNGHCSYYIGT